MDFCQCIRTVQELDNLKSDINRIYFGSEFCDFLVPSYHEIIQAYQDTQSRGLDFTLKTPLITQKRLNHFLDILEKTISFILPAKIEIVVNDLGLLRYLCNRKKEHKYNAIEPVIGRFITRQKTDPMTRLLKGKIPDDTYWHFCEPVANNSYFIKYLLKNNIRRIELENTYHEIRLETKLSEVLEFSLHKPWVSVATTRLCPTALLSKGYVLDSSNSGLNIPSCSKECKKKKLRIRGDNIFTDFWFYGNTLFYKNEHIPSGIKNLNIDRIVIDNHCTS